MPLRRTRPNSMAQNERASKRRAAIDAAFDQAAGYDLTLYSRAPSPPDSHRTSRARAVVPDDEEEDVEMELVAGPTAPPDAAGPALSTEEGGGFVTEPSTEMALGGGFVVDDDLPGGFLPDPHANGGGFLPEPPSSEAAAGGFLREPSTDAAPGGFFLPQDPSSAESPAHPSAPDFGAAGGFLPPPPVNLTEFGGGGGFLVDESSDNMSLPTPAPLAHRLPTPPPPPSRIPLARIPAALRSLGLHRVGLAGAELIALFDEVASEDEEDPIRTKSVRRERFIEACEVLLGDEESSSSVAAADEGRPTTKKSGRGGATPRTEDEDVREPGPTRRERSQPSRRQPVRRSARQKIVNDAADASVGEEGSVADRDFGDEDAPDETSSFSASASEDDGNDDEDEDEDETFRGSKAAAKKGTKGRRGVAKRGDPSRPVSKQDLADAVDSFDLFFDESPQLAFEHKERAITLLELQRACRVLKEKMSDGELNEMLEYAARSKGVVDLEAFARILAETGL